MMTRDKTWVVVGNGPAIQGSGLGKLIDAHDEVVRLNTFTVRGYEADVGTRTTLWIASAAIQIPDWVGGKPAHCLLFSGKVDNLPWSRVPRDYIWAKKQRVLKASQWVDKTKLAPSTGFTAICWLIERGMAARIDLVGMDHFSKESTRRHHYWDPKNYNKPPQHDGDAEEKLLHRFVDAGKLRYIRSTEQGDRHD